jgi:serine/threonine protein kinase
MATSIDTISAGNIPKIKSSDVKMGEKLGAGAFGEVYKGRWKNQDVAVKKIDASGIYRLALLGIVSHKYFKTIDQFDKEAKVMSKLNHRYILSLLAIIVEDSWFFGTTLCFVIPIMDCSLYQLMDGKGNLAADNYFSPAPRQATFHKELFRRKLHFMKGVAAGTAYLHGQKVIHRDLKSDNVLIKKERAEQDLVFYRPRIADYGLATQGNTGRNTGEIKFYKGKFEGTEPWSAPETFSGKFYDKSDVYSLGVIFLEVFSGLCPYMGSYQKFSREAVENGLRPSIMIGEAETEHYEQTHWTQHLPAVHQLIESCWDQEPKKRPSAASCTEKLTQLLKQKNSAPRDYKKEVDRLTKERDQLRKEKREVELRNERLVGKNQKLREQLTALASAGDKPEAEDVELHEAPQNSSWWPSAWFGNASTPKSSAPTPPPTASA